jgi:hypothetical protein
MANEGNVQLRGSKQKWENLSITTTKLGNFLKKNAFTMSPYTRCSIVTTLEPIDADIVIKLNFLSAWRQSPSGVLADLVFQNNFLPPLAFFVTNTALQIM